MLSNKETSKFYVSLPDDSINHYGNLLRIHRKPANVSSDAHAKELLDIPHKSNTNKTSDLVTRLSSEDEPTKRMGFHLTDEFIHCFLSKYLLIPSYKALVIKSTFYVPLNPPPKPPRKRKIDEIIFHDATTNPSNILKPPNPLPS